MVAALTMSHVSDDLQNNWAAANSSTSVARSSECVTLDQNLRRLQDNIRELNIAPIDFSRPQMPQDTHARIQGDNAGNAGDCLRQEGNVGGLVDQQSSHERTDSESRDTDSIDTAVLDSYLDDPPTPDSAMYYVRHICFDSLPLSPRQRFLSEVKCQVPQHRMARHRSNSGNSRFKDVTHPQHGPWKVGYSGDICRSMPDVTIHSRSYRRAAVAGDVDGSNKPWISATRRVSEERIPSPCGPKQPVASSSFGSEIPSMRLSGVWAGDGYNGSAGSPTQRRISSHNVPRSKVNASSSCTPNITGSAHGTSMCEGEFVDGTEVKLLNTTGHVEAVQSMTSSSLPDERINENMVGKVLDVDCYKLSLLPKNGNSSKDVLADNSQTTSVKSGDHYTGQETTTDITVEETTSRVCQDALYENDGDKIKAYNEDSISNASVDMEEVLLAFENICGDDGPIKTGLDHIHPEVVEVQPCSDQSPEGAVDAELQTALSKLRADKAVSEDSQCYVTLYFIAENNMYCSPSPILSSLGVDCHDCFPQTSLFCESF